MGDVEKQRRFSGRVAAKADIPAIGNLMGQAIPALLAPYLSPEQIEAAFGIMGLDTQLVEDGTYYVIENKGRIVGCGGWSRRATLFGVDHTTGRDANLLDPAKDAARIRAMYTHPEWTRNGIGRRILELSEQAALREGFARFELASTLSGEPLYRACGYEPVEEFEEKFASGVRVPLIRMEKRP